MSFAPLDKEPDIMLPPYRPGARNADPATSHEADETQRKASFGKQARLVLAAVRKWPGRSSLRLASDIHAEWLHSPDYSVSRTLDRYQVARRLSDLRELGWVENRYDSCGHALKEPTGMRWWSTS